MKTLRVCGAVLAAFFLITFAFALPVFADSISSVAIDQEAVAEGLKKPGYSPYAGRAFPTRVYWGDTHIHTSNSLDAVAFGVRIGPEEAFRFARGEEVTATHGERVKLSRPLDWLVVADHSDGIGAMLEIVAGNPALLKDPKVRDWHNRVNQGGDAALAATMDIINAFTQGNLPEVLISKEMLPYTTMESFNPEDLWNWMERYEEKSGGKVLALAHNGNLSNGIMFPVETNPATGKRLTGNYAKERMRWEPLYEVTQIKGDGETHSVLSPNDEFADYETWDQGNLNLSVIKSDEMLQYEYAREALKNGLKLEAKLGTNPYKFGMVGSTDAHTALATAEEENFFGKHSGNEPNPKRADHIIGQFGERKYMGWDMAAAGYAAVWATENTQGGLCHNRAKNASTLFRRLGIYHR